MPLAYRSPSPCCFALAVAERLARMRRLGTGEAGERMGIATIATIRAAALFAID